MTTTTATVLFWLVPAIITTYLAKTRGRNVLGFFVYSLLFWPAALASVLLTRSYRRRCHACQEVVHDAASVCPHCRTGLGAGPAADGAQAT
jgi:hypothetical protein